METNELKKVLEALLISAGVPLTIEKMQEAFEEWQKPSRAAVEKALAALTKDYEMRAFELVVVASGYCVQTKANYSTWINRFNTEKPQKYSRALLETLAIIAYRQPVSRADIEEIRGVSVSSSILKTLQEREWIKVGGYRDVPGKPAVYITTKNFLDYFNLKSLNDLPSLHAISETLAVTVDESFPAECEI